MPVYRNLFASTKCIGRYINSASELYRIPQSPGRMVRVSAQELFCNDHTTPHGYARDLAKKTWGRSELRQPVHVYVDCSDSERVTPDDIHALSKSRDANLRFYLMLVYNDPLTLATHTSPPPHHE